MTAQSVDQNENKKNDSPVFSKLNNEVHSEWAHRILNSKFFNDNSTKKEEKWGYDLYPERKQLFQSSLTKILKMQEGRELYDKMKCEENVYECVKRSPLVKLMMSALKSAGW